MKQIIRVETPTGLLKQIDTEVTIFPDSYWIDTPTGWILLHSSSCSVNPQVLGVIVRHFGGGGSWSFVELANAGLYLIPSTYSSDEVLYNLGSDYARFTINRYSSLSKLTSFPLTALQGTMVTNVTATLKLVNPDTRTDLTDEEGDWSLL